ncbi:MAG: lipopolysaccharide biosynthesis protein [Solirubrobacterales bacterium]
MSAKRLGGLGAMVSTAIRSNRELLSNASSMVGTAVVTSFLGAAFWWVATHYFSQDAVGLASASISAMTLLGFMGTVGLGTLLMGELPRLEIGHRSVINGALVMTASVGTALGLLFVVIAPLASSSFDPLEHSWITALVFAAGVGLTALTFVLDQALIGMLRGGIQLSRNIVFSVVKLAALVPVATAVSDAGPEWIYATWTAGIAVSLVVLVRFYRHRDDGPMGPDFSLLKSMRVHALTHHGVNIALRTPELVLPIVVVTFLSASANASFYIAYMITGFMFFVPLSLSTVLYAVGSGESKRLADRFRLTVYVSLGFGAISNLALLVLATPLLSIFGASYADDATSTLHVLALDIFPSTILSHFVALRRIQRRLATALPLVWLGALLQVGGGVLGALLGGLVGVAIGWVAGATIEAIIMGPEVLRALKATHLEGAEETEPKEREVEAMEAFETATTERL